MDSQTLGIAIPSLHEASMALAQERQNQLTKPAGSLGRLEGLSVQLAGIMADPRPKVSRKAVVVMAGDHGVAQQGVSAYPPEVTPQMVMNFLAGGAAINVLSRQAGARVTIVPGSRDQCAEVCRAKVAQEGTYYASHVYNPFFYEGTKTYIYEVWEQLGRIPAHLFVPLGNGTLFLGMVKALEELLAAGFIAKMPRIIAVQSEHCDPIARAYEDGASSPAHITPLPTLAEGIAIGVPMRGEEILYYIYKYNMKVITAPEERILEARAALAGHGIYCEHTSAAIYAAYLAWCEKHGRTYDSLIPMCGAGLKSDQ